MTHLATPLVASAVRARAHELGDAPEDLDPLLDRIGDAHLVLVGEASHGTHEFYELRAEITKRLILEKGFDAVAVEADWPDAYRVNRYVRLQGDDREAIDALGDFKRFPSWMWRNADVLDFVGWLRAHNEKVAEESRVGFYGLDLYSLHRSIGAVIEYLDKVDRAEAKYARQRYACFDHADAREHDYERTAAFRSCEKEVVAQLVALQARAAGDHFYAEQNARLARNAERYYRAVVGGRRSSWNLRDLHMTETLEELVGYLSGQRGAAKVVVWEHNSHLGDARATEMSERGELNVGQLVRERHGHDAVLVGFSTYSGTVTAASDWDAPAERKNVRPGLPGSWEELFHETGFPRFLLIPGRDDGLDALDEPRPERAIGVIYRPETERLSHYFDARLMRQFDAVLHIDQTRALEPLDA
ncbi:MAG: erythromycin esterase family protein [Planctomycetota bacterium]